MRFSILSLFIPLTGLLAAGCSSSRVASSEYDDVYYSSRDVTSRTVVTTETTTYPEYRSEATGLPEGEQNPEYNSSGGSTYITNNYQTEYYRRDYFGGYDPLYRPSAYRLSYWDVPYNNYSWYNPYAPGFNLAVYSYPFYHRHYGWYDSPFFYGGYGYPVRPGVTISIGFGYYDYWGWNPYNYWGGYYGNPYWHRGNYYGGGGYYRGFYDGFYASGGNRRSTHYGRRQERSVVPTSGISASGGRINPATRPNRDGRVETGGRQQMSTGVAPVNDQRNNVRPAVREERGIKPTRENTSDMQQARPNAMPASTETRPATEGRPVRQYDSAPTRNETGVKPDRQQVNPDRPADNQRPAPEARPVPNEVRPSRQETVRPDNYQFQEQPGRPARTNEMPVRSTESDYKPARDAEQMSRPERPAQVQPEPYRPAPERPVNTRPDRSSERAPEYVQPERSRGMEPQIERPARQEKRPVFRQEQPAPRQMQERPREQRSPSYEQPARPMSPSRDMRPMESGGSRMRSR